MKNLAWKSSACAFVGAGIVALAAAYLAHTVLGMPRGHPI
jgi:asparagine N-glycosylation enzyme membrane subunit Stt3